jgi:hypothetical protein
MLYGDQTREDEMGEEYSMLGRDREMYTELQSKSLKEGRRIWENNIKIDHKATGYEDVEWSDPVQVGISGRLL